MTAAVVSLYHGSGQEDPSDVGEVIGPFVSEAEAKRYAEQRMSIDRAKVTTARAAQDRWNQRRGELFGDAWPLSEDQANALGDYPADPDVPALWVVAAMVPP